MRHAKTLRGKFVEALSEIDGVSVVGVDASPSILGDVVIVRLEDGREVKTSDLEIRLNATALDKMAGWAAVTAAGSWMV